jgi:hypothetical protein
MPGHYALAPTSSCSGADTSRQIGRIRSSHRGIELRIPWLERPDLSQRAKPQADRKASDDHGAHTAARVLSP